MHSSPAPTIPKKPLWWWCDALFMAPPVLADLSKDTGDAKYLDFMDREWWITSTLLYDSKLHLYSRDATFLDKHEPDGNKLFWARGNGWVLAGLARVLTRMPATYPGRQKYVAQFQEIAKSLAGLQGQDGLWRPGLLDAKAYPLPEVSGSAFITYALAMGHPHRPPRPQAISARCQESLGRPADSHLSGWPSRLYPAHRRVSR